VIAAKKSVIGASRIQARSMWSFLVQFHPGAEPVLEIDARV